MAGAARSAADRAAAVLPRWALAPVRGIGLASILLATWALADAWLPRAVPVGIVLQGTVQGALVSFTAMGLVLVYRAARFLNFSQAAIGGIAASMAELAVLGWHLDFWVALVIGLLAAALVGAAVNATVVRRLQRAPRLVVTVATVGLLQVLSVANGYVPDLAANVGFGSGFNTPLTGHYTVGGVVFTGNDTAAMVVVPIVLVAMWWFLSRTETGTAVRAVADSPERAGLLGIPVRRVSTVVWVVAALLSGLGTVLTSAIDHPPVGVPLTPQDLFPALAAFVLAGLDSLPGAVAWSLVIGVVDAAVYWVYRNATYAEVVVFVLVVVGVALRRRRAARVDDGGLGDFVAAREVPPVPRAVAALPAVRWGTRAVTVAALAAAVLVPLGVSASQLDLMTAVPVYAILGLSLVVLTGWAGQISLGQFAFGGIGAIVTGVLVVHAGADLFVALAAAVAACAVVAVLVGSTAARLPGLALAAVTMAFAVAVSDWLMSSYYFPFLNPQSVPRPVLFGRFPTGVGSPVAFYELCLVLMVLSLVVVRNLRRTRAGRTIIAVRDNARGASAYAIDPRRARFVALAVAGGLAGLAGGLYLVQLGGLGSGGLTTTDSLTVFIMVVIGGLTSPLGAVAGAVVFEGIVYLVAPQLQQLATGAGVLVFLMFLPEGIGGAVLRVRSAVLRVVTRRLGIMTGLLEDGNGASGGLASRAGAQARADAGLGADGAPLAGTLPAVAALGGTRPAAARATSTVPGSLVAVALADAGLGGGRAVAATMTATTRRLVVRGLDVAIGQAPIVAGVDLDVGAGQIVALLGTNGAGKSTTLRALAGALPVRRGTVLVDGVDVTRMPVERRVRRGVVLVPGGRGVFPSLTVAENLRLAGWTARRSSSGRTALAASTGAVHRLFPHLAEREDVPAGMLSGGEQQMLALAQGLLCNPSVLLIDELSLGLAPTVVSQLLRVVGDLAGTGVAVVLVEQSVNIAAAVADDAVFVERGRVRFRGPTRELSDSADLVRSVFLGAGDPGASGGGSSVPAGGGSSVPAGGGSSTAKTVPGARLADGSAGTAGSGRGAAPVLALDGISRSFGGVAAVTDVSLAVRPGEIVGLIGANGAGKTTLLDIVSGFVAPDRGQILLAGNDVTQTPAARRARLGLGRVFQDARLFPSLTVAEAVATAAERHVAVADPFLSLWWTAAVRFSEEAVSGDVDRMLATMGLQDLRDRMVSELSTGTRRVVELACATIHRPDVLLLDEPSAGLAQRECEALGERLQRLRGELGAGFLVVEHDVPLLASIADRLVCMHLGAVVASGSPADVLADPVVLRSYLGTDAVAVGRSGPMVPAAR